MYSSQESTFVPLFPLPLVLFPYMPLPLHVFEPRYRVMIRNCIEHKQPFGLIRAGTTGTAWAGCLAEIRSVLQRFEDGRFDILSFGTQRFSVLNFDTSKEYLQASVRPFSDTDASEPEPAPELKLRAVELFLEFARLNGRKPAPANLDRMSREEFSFLICQGELFSLEEKQELLELRDTEERILRCSRRLEEGIHQRKSLALVEQQLKGPTIEELKRLLS